MTEGSPRKGGKCEIIKRDPWEGMVDRTFMERVGLENLTEKLDDAMRRGKILKDGSKSFVSLVAMEGREVVVKGYHHLGWVHSLRHTFQGSRAKRAWKTANHLCGLGVTTPRPLAYIDEYRGFLLWKSYFIYEYVSGPSLQDFLEDSAVPEKQKHRRIEQVIEVLSHLSEHGLSHGDLKHTNMICNGDAVVFIDLDALRQTFPIGFLKRHRYEKDKARFLRDVRLFER
ncbi:MAG TPA: lipopolysaccharide kinase InaA family protein [Syntrophales bacterium]|nr:lipopolysaccharide kinase InaA family protein [Syntrophales bacterium]HPX55659.1 lipopolysaccharide kinase InaA family protein [Syntrophales bacterium]HQA83016.1 lipopolysaccharide kinase InaA family protein [Syntrophales bacterium]